METRVTVIPREEDQPYIPRFRAKCQGSTQCIRCKLTGFHDQTPQENTTLMKQATIGIMVMIVLGSVIMAAIYLTLKMVRIL